MFAGVRRLFSFRMKKLEKEQLKTKLLEGRGKGIFEGSTITFRHLQAPEIPDERFDYAIDKYFLLGFS